MHTNNYKDIGHLVVENNLCVGCGVCSPACPENVIDIKFDIDKGVYLPKINFEGCTQCSICFNTCQKNFDLFFNTKNKIENSENYVYGYGDVKKFYIGHTVDGNERLTSASGGLLSATLKYMIKNKIVEGAVVTKFVSGNIGGELFKPFFATSPEDIDKAKGSHYYPIEFSKILELTKDYSSFVVVALPCVIYSLKKLKGLKKKKVYYFTLACGGFRDGNFLNHLNRSKRLNIDRLEKLEYRNKIKIDFGDNFNLLMNNENIKFKDYYGNLWNTMFYKTDGCNLCPDFSGLSADSVFFDAWLPEHRIDPKGTSILAIRDQEVLEIIQKMHSEHLVDIKEISSEQAILSQAPQIEKAEERFFIWADKQKLLSNSIKQKHLNKFNKRNIKKYLNEFYIYRGKMALFDLIYKKMKLYNVSPRYLDLLFQPNRVFKGIFKKIKRLING